MHRLNFQARDFSKYTWIFNWKIKPIALHRSKTIQSELRRRSHEFITSPQLKPCLRVSNERSSNFIFPSLVLDEIELIDETTFLQTRLFSRKWSYSNAQCFLIKAVSRFYEFSYSCRVGEQKDTYFMSEWLSTRFFWANECLLFSMAGSHMCDYIRFLKTNSRALRMKDLSKLGHMQLRAETFIPM